MTVARLQDVTERKAMGVIRLLGIASLCEESTNNPERAGNQLGHKGKKAKERTALG